MTFNGKNRLALRCLFLNNECNFLNINVNCGGLIGKLPKSSVILRKNVFLFLIFTVFNSNHVSFFPSHDDTIFPCCLCFKPAK